MLPRLPTAPRLLMPALLIASVLAVVAAVSEAGQSSRSSDGPPASRPTSQPATRPATEKLEIGSEAFELELAATPEARELGLMHRDHIDEHGGMLFIYPWPQVLGYWMKNCPIEMDIIFINDKGVVVATHRMLPAPPHRPSETEQEYDDRLPRYDSRRPAQFAVELKAGTIERLKVRPGDKIEMDVKRLARLAPR